MGVTTLVDLSFGGPLCIYFCQDYKKGAKRVHMKQPKKTKLVKDGDFQVWIQAFLQDRKAQDLTPGTLYFYQEKLKIFTEYCEARNITSVMDVTSVNIREYMLYLGEKHHNEGGKHCCYRALKTFLRWYEQEVEPEGWTNPIRKVKAPKLTQEPLEPISIEDIKAMLETCTLHSMVSLRDKAIILALLDTGNRANEFLAINLDDLDRTQHSILIRKGKGRKPRMVYLGQKSRKAVRAYLKVRNDDSDALWVSDVGERLTYWGLRSIIRRRAVEAGIKEPPCLHSFRRAFALNCLRNGMDIFSLQLLMGHSDLQVLRRYLKQTDQDTDEAHRKGGPVDNTI